MQKWVAKFKIVPNPFVQMLYDTDAEFALVKVNEVANAIFSAGTKTGLHG